MLFDMKPNLFDEEERERHTAIRKKVQYTVPFACVSFIAVSILKFKLYHM